MDLDDERQAEELDRQQYEQSKRVMENFDPGDYLIDDDLGDYLTDDDDYYDPNGEPCWQCWSTVEKQKWAATWQNQQNDLCAQRRLRSTWASA